MTGCNDCDRMTCGRCWRHPRVILKLALLVLCLAASILATPAAEYEIQLAVNAGYVAQVVEDPDTGEENTEWSPTVLTGIQAFGSGNFGFSAGAAALPDEEESTPRVAPYVAVHWGTPSAQFYAGCAFDTQNGGGNDLVATFGFTAAFGR